MSKTAVLTDQDAGHKARAEGYLTEIQRTLHELATERRRAERRRTTAPSLVAEVRAILKGT
jgi:hypothetical protein